MDLAQRLGQRGPLLYRIDRAEQRIDQAQGQQHECGDDRCGNRACRQGFGGGCQHQHGGEGTGQHHDGLAQAPRPGTGAGRRVRALLEVVQPGEHVLGSIVGAQLTGGGGHRGEAADHFGANDGEVAGRRAIGQQRRGGPGEQPAENGDQERGHRAGTQDRDGDDSPQGGAGPGHRWQQDPWCQVTDPVCGLDQVLQRRPTGGQGPGGQAAGG